MADNTEPTMGELAEQVERDGTLMWGGLTFRHAGTYQVTDDVDGLFRHLGVPSTWIRRPQ